MLSRSAKASYGFDGLRRAETKSKRLPQSALRHSHKANSTLLFIEFRETAEFSFCAKRGKENPSLREGKSKLFPSANRAFSKGCAGPSRHFAISSLSGVSGEIRAYRECAIGARAPGSQSGGRRRSAFSLTIGLAIEATMAE